MQEVFGGDLLFCSPFGEHQRNGVETQCSQRPDDEADIAGYVNADDGGKHDEKRHDHRALQGLGDVHGQHLAFIGVACACTLLQAFTRRLHRVENRLVAMFFERSTMILSVDVLTLLLIVTTQGDMNPCRLRPKS